MCLDQRGLDYGEISVAYRPSHTDAIYDMKYGVRLVQELRCVYFQFASGIALKGSIYIELFIFFMTVG
ncbi:Chorismate synthase [Arabidopsis thaliana x Arabidopsis arenosa]|uniref:Chorismate synthase n=1 Tax=Arabidopsis thaliana x Arabidopsis arenosa TaxID=1240361 RepID=A0A8T1XMI4_9BRAS|nr:Chorismate synthase [Arabidopsis thaliana x Arabidopsis arenosa]